MESVENTKFNAEVIKKLSYPFGHIYIFEGFVVSELDEGIIYSWDNQGKVLAKDLARLLGTNGTNLYYISNRINDYSVIPSDWTKYFNSKYTLKAYCVVSQSKMGIINAKVEGLFFKSEIKHFKTIDEAISWVKRDMTSGK